jgi:hypothetical protein
MILVIIYLIGYGLKRVKNQFFEAIIPKTKTRNPEKSYRFY